MTHPENHFWDIVAGRAAWSEASVLLGYTLIEADPVARTLSAHFCARPEFLNPAGLVQGGIVCAFLDEVMSSALAATLEPGEFCATVRMAVRFVRPARVGPLRGEAKVTRRRGQYALLRGRLTDLRGRTLATGIARAQVMAGHV